MSAAAARRTSAAGVRADSPQALRGVGEALARLLRAGDLVVLCGPLGAGKTTLTQGIGSGLGVRGPVTSPTFVLARAHPTLTDGPALVHVDAYRLCGPQEIDDLDLDAALDEVVTVVEWGTGLVEGLSSNRLEVSIDVAEDDARLVTVVGVGERWGDVAIGPALSR